MDFSILDNSYTLNPHTYLKPLGRRRYILGSDIASQLVKRVIEDPRKTGYRGHWEFDEMTDITLGSVQDEFASFRDIGEKCGYSIYNTTTEKFNDIFPTYGAPSEMDAKDSIGPYMFDRLDKKTNVHVGKKIGGYNIMNSAGGRFADGVWVYIYDINTVYEIIHGPIYGVRNNPDKKVSRVKDCIEVTGLVTRHEGERIGKMIFPALEKLQAATIKFEEFY